jgi:hypothetical protein
MFEQRWYRMMRIVPLLLLSMLVFVTASCGRTVSLEGRPCPCGDGYTCCADRCVAGTSCVGGPATWGPDRTQPGGAYGPYCPPSMPTDGSPCSAVSAHNQFGVESADCVYGDYVDQECDTGVACSPSDPRFGGPPTWRSDGLDLDRGLCPIPLDAVDPLESVPYEDTSCPATYADAQSAGDCAAPHAACSYHEGLCMCDTGANPQAQHDFQWTCAPVPTGCPARPPLTGMSCATEGQTCDYGSCLFNAPTWTCQDGAWRKGGGATHC